MEPQAPICPIIMSNTIYIIFTIHHLSIMKTFVKKKKNGNSRHIELDEQCKSGRKMTSTRVMNEKYHLAS